MPYILVENEDILAQVPRTLVKVGFAAETEDVLKNAEKKLTSKGADLIFANDVSRADSGFGADTNQVVVLSKDHPPRTAAADGEVRGRRRDPGARGSARPKAIPRVMSGSQ